MPRRTPPVDLTENCALELITVDQYFGFTCSYVLQYQHLRFKHIIEVVLRAHENQTIRQGQLQPSVTSIEFAQYGSRVQNSVAVSSEAFQVARQSAGGHSKRQHRRYEGSHGGVLKICGKPRFGRQATDGLNPNTLIDSIIGIFPDDDKQKSNTQA
jgi:hypothetical protein